MSGNFSKDVVSYGNLRFPNLGWEKFIQSLLDWSYQDYNLTNKGVDQALRFYRDIPLKSLIADASPEVSGKVLRDVFFQEFSDKSGFSIDDVLLKRACLKIPQALGSINLFGIVDSNDVGIYKPMFKMIDRKKVRFSDLNSRNIKAFRFHSADGDVFIDLENRRVFWSVLKKFYFMHHFLIDVILRELKYCPFPGSYGGIVIDNGSSYFYGDEKDAPFENFSSSGWSVLTKVNCLLLYKEGVKSSLSEDLVKIISEKRSA